MNKDNRKKTFAKWWKRNRRNSKAHDWIIHNAKRVAKTYLLHPQVFEEINFIATRFYKSEFRKLNEKDAWKLWRISNPNMDEKMLLLKRAAEFAETKMDELSEMRKGWTKPETQKEKKKPTVTVKKKRKFTLNTTVAKG